MQNFIMPNHRFAFILIVVPILFPLSSLGQNSKRLQKNNAYYSVLQEGDVVAYFNEKLDSIKKHHYSSTTNYRQKHEIKTDFFRLYPPFVYDENLINETFNVIDDSAEYENVNNLKSLLYLKYGGLIKTTRSYLLKTDTIKAVYDKPVNQDIGVIDVALPAVIEPDFNAIDLVVEKPNFWKYSGEFYLQFLQNYISGNWYKGGESNYSALSSVTLEASYNNKQKVKWDNKLEMKLGMLTSKSDSLHSMKTSEDLLRLTSKFGLQASKRWYYTFQFLAYSQFYKGYKSNDPTVYSDFLSPLNINLSLGMDYSVEAIKRRLIGNIHLAPIAYNLRYVRKLPLSTRYGLDEGKHVLHDLGSQFTVDLTWKIIDNIMWKTRLYGFTTYKRFEFEWENTFTLKFNRFISSNIFVYPRFDDDSQRDGHHGYWQLKEFISVGLSYSF